MHQLLPELLSRIYELACTDDGKTGRSLALVSKYINETSQPYKLQSVNLFGARKICAFAKTLEEIEDGGMGRGIWHLRIELKGEEEQPYPYGAIELYNASSHSAHSPISRLRRKLPRILRKITSSNSPTINLREARLQYELSITDAFFRILTLAAPTLRSLHFTLSLTPHQSTNAGCYHMPSFPFLRSLVPDYNNHSWSLFDDRLLPWSPIPSLQTLDLTGYGEHTIAGRQYADIRRFAPGLRELRIPVRASHGLRKALGDETEGGDPNTLPSTIQSIFIIFEDQVRCQLYDQLVSCTSCARLVSSELIDTARDLAVVDHRVRLDVE